MSPLKCANAVLVSPDGGSGGVPAFHPWTKVQSKIQTEAQARHYTIIMKPGIRKGQPESGELDES